MFYLLVIFAAILGLVFAAAAYGGKALLYLGFYILVAYRRAKGALRRRL